MQHFSAWKSSRRGSDGVTKRILVLLATHNGMRWIDQQLTSIRNQVGVQVSVLASDDASTDGTFEYLTSSSDIQLLPERGPYGTAGKNFFHLLSHADFTGCDFVALADQDDIWSPRKLARAVECLMHRPCDGYGANAIAFWEDGREALLDKAHPQREWDFLFEAAGPGCTYVLSVAVAMQIQQALRENPGIAAEIFLHDWFVYAWTRSHGFKWFTDPQTNLRYRQHGRNEMGINLGSKAAKRRLDWLRSGWYRGQVCAIARACGVESTPFVRLILSRTWKGRIALALASGRCRRRSREALILSVAAILGWF
jgi:rhamnosyltransferase